MFNNEIKTVPEIESIKNLISRTIPFSIWSKINERSEKDVKMYWYVVDNMKKLLKEMITIRNNGPVIVSNGEIGIDYLLVNK